MAALVATGARAEEYKIGEVDLTVSGAVTAGTEVRTAPRDPRLHCHMRFHTLAAEIGRTRNQCSRIANIIIVPTKV